MSLNTQGHSVANIQILRGFAALLVVCHHIIPQLIAAYHITFRPNFGAFGVDIFFVISGFVMYYSNQTMNRSVRSFLIARFIRIVPLYWLATAIIAALFVAGFKPVGVYALTPKMVAEALVFIPSIFPDGRRDLVVSIGWTLMYELFFYLWFALSFRLRTPARSFAAVAGVFVILSVIGWVAPALPYLVRFFLSPIILEFLYGGLLAFAYLRWPEGRNPAAAIVAALAMAAAFALIPLQDAAGWPLPLKEGVRFVLFGIPAAIIVGGALVLEKSGFARRTGFLQLVGAASYSLYLFHPVIVQVVVKAGLRFAPKAFWAGAPVIVAIALAAALAVGIAVHLLVERRILAIGKRLTTRPA